MGHKINMAEAILSINPNAQVSIWDENYDTIEWFAGTEKISKADIEAKQAELQIAYDAKEYQRQRKKEYPTIEELVVALYDTDDKADIESKRAAIKAKSPKGS